MNENEQNLHESIRQETKVDTSTPDRFLETLKCSDTLPTLTQPDLERLYESMTQQQIVDYYVILNQFLNEATGQLLIKPDQVVRPKVLFHSSGSGNVEIFEPRAEKKRHPDDPPQIFGSPSEAVCSMFLIPTDDSFVRSGSYDSCKSWTYIIGDFEKFKSLDKGGWIYALPATNFNVSPNEGLGLFEWTSNKNVPVENKKYFPSGLQAMLDYDIKIYVVDKALFKRFNSEEEDHIQLLQTLKPITADKI